jgi:hypothetical protein
VAGVTILLTTRLGSGGASRDLSGSTSMTRQDGTIPLLVKEPEREFGQFRTYLLDNNAGMTPRAVPGYARCPKAKKTW